MAISLSIPAGKQAVVTIGLSGSLRKKIVITGPSSFSQSYTSCIDGKRLFIVLDNSAGGSSAAYSIDPTIYDTTCSGGAGSAIALSLDSTTSTSGGSGSYPIYIEHDLYLPTNTGTYPDNAVGVTIVVQTEIGEL